MKKKHLSILADLLEQIEKLKATIKDPSKLAAAAFYLIDEVIIKVNKLYCEHEFPSQEDEIHFFKIARPQFLALLFFYNCVYKFESYKPYNCKSDLKKYLIKHRVIIKCFSNENREFYKYHNSGNTCFDQIYFVRSKHDIKKCINSALFIADDRFCTNHCYLTGKLLANELFSAYIETRLQNLKNKPMVIEAPKYPNIKPKWTAHKVCLVELAYALYEDGAVNNGDFEVKEIIGLLETAFNISLEYYSTTFLELRQRKNGKTNYLDNLKEKLLSRMEKEEP